MANKWVLAGAAATLLLAGCGRADSGESSDEPVDAEDMTIGVSNLGLSFPFPASIGEGIKAKADELGVEIIELDAQGKAEKQATDVQDLIGQQPDGVLLLPVDSGVATGLVDQLESAGIPTVAVASQVGDPETREIDDVYPGLVALVTQAEVEAGRMAGELAVEAVPEGGDIAVVEGAAGFAEVELRYEEFLTPAEEAGVTFNVVAQQPGDWLPATAQSACQNMLASNPGIKLFYAESDDMAVGCAKAVDAAGSDAVVIGVGGSELGIDAVKSGEVYGTVCYKPKDMGELAMQVLYDDLTGAEEYDAEFITYDTPAITKQNVDECQPQW